MITGLLIPLIGIVLIIAIAWWFFKSVPIPAPFSWVIQAVVAIILIIVVADLFLGGGLHFGHY